jgi:SAM-dependent methyltransferase
MAIPEPSTALDRVANLLDNWIPSLSGVAARLGAGARVADVGCGYGITTVLMAQRFPASTFHGFDHDPGSIDRARTAAAEADVSDSVSFEVCDAAQIPALGYDLVCTFDALHDHGHPEAAAWRVRECLLPGGSWMIVEPRAGDSVPENPSVPDALPQGGDALCAQAGEQALRDMLFGVGFADVRVTAETPFHTVLQARVSREQS